MVVMHKFIQKTIQPFRKHLKCLHQNVELDYLKLLRPHSSGFKFELWCTKLRWRLLKLQIFSYLVQEKKN